MRLRSISAVVSCATLLAVAAVSSRAVAQIEFAKSTIRLTSATEPATPGEVASQTPVTETVEQQSPTRSRAMADDEPPAPVTPHVVRPANFVAPIAARPLVQRQMPSRAPSLGIYTGTSARATLNRLPRPAPVRPNAAALPKHPRGKPFQGVQNDPTVSPYLNLYRSDDNANNLPNYFAFVRPQLEQIETNRQQTAELQKLRGQVQNMSSGGAGQPSTNMPSSARYMDTAQFYRGMRR